MNNVVRFLSEVRIELSRIEWPRFDEFVGSVAVVLFLVLIFSLFLGSVDSVISWCAKKIFAYSL